MLLTTSQTADKLGFKTTGPIRRLIAAGQLTNVAQGKPGKSYKRGIDARIDSKEVEKYLVEHRNGNAVKPSSKQTARPEKARPAASSEGLRAQLSRIEQKLDRILGLLN